jgi:hypothetical protein
MRVERGIFNECGAPIKECDRLCPTVQQSDYYTSPARWPQYKKRACFLNIRASFAEKMRGY